MHYKILQTPSGKYGIYEKRTIIPFILSIWIMRRKFSTLESAKQGIMLTIQQSINEVRERDIIEFNTFLL